MNQSKINYVNVVMKSINDSTDDIYEALIDEQYVDLFDHIYTLTEILNELKSIHDEEL